MKVRKTDSPLDGNQSMQVVWFNHRDRAEGMKTEESSYLPGVFRT